MMDSAAPIPEARALDHWVLRNHHLLYKNKRIDQILCACHADGFTMTILFPINNKLFLPNGHVPGNARASSKDIFRCHDKDRDALLANHRNFKISKTDQHNGFFSDILWTYSFFDVIVKVVWSCRQPWFCYYRKSDIALCIHQVILHAHPYERVLFPLYVLEFHRQVRGKIKGSAAWGGVVVLIVIINTSPI